MEEETNPPREQQASIERHAVHHQEKVGSSGTAPDGKENGEAVAVDGGFGPGARSATTTSGDGEDPRDGVGWLTNSWRGGTLVETGDVVVGGGASRWRWRWRWNGVGWELGMGKRRLRGICLVVFSLSSRLVCSSPPLSLLRCALLGQSHAYPRIHVFFIG